MPKPARREYLQRATSHLQSAHELVAVALRYINKAKDTGTDLTHDEASELANLLYRITNLALGIRDRYDLHPPEDWDARLRFHALLDGPNLNPIINAQVDAEPDETITRFILDVWPHLDGEGRWQLTNYVSTFANGIRIEAIENTDTGEIVGRADRKGRIGMITGHGTIVGEQEDE